MELSCHGSPVILGRVIELAVQRGARLAQPGEFTFRAFFNKRIDLAQAQAVRDVINSQTRYQARVASKQMHGGLSRRLTPLKEEIVEVLVHLESSLEFVEDDISPEGRDQIAQRLRSIQSRLSELASSFSFGRLLRDGFALAIIGRPNVGKSSAFNRLVGSERAIVTPLPGTTRDALREEASICGVPVRLVDTAGIRETEDVVESIGISRSREALVEADLCLLILDASEEKTVDDIRLLEEIPESRRIVLNNKIDLRRPSPEDAAIAVSALTGEGFDQLREMIVKHLAGNAVGERDDIMITDARQHAALRAAAEGISEAGSLIEQGELEEIVSLRLRGSLSALGEITGETLTEDILNQIFLTFCIGK